MMSLYFFYSMWAEQGLIQNQGGKNIMAALMNKHSRIFFWLRKKNTEKSRTQKHQDQNDQQNLTIASFWQNQLMNIANDKGNTNRTNQR